MSAEKIAFEQLQETLYHEQLPNGLDVYVLPKQGFHKVYATFTTRYGSIDNHFDTATGETVSVPDGIAHFLEHKMFESKEGDVFHEFSKRGAQANAFTSFDRTAYLFSTTSHVQDNLRTLLGFVQDPYFTDENVDKEKGIIEQEIRMYDDNPDWRLYFGLIRAMYARLPVRIDIAGTVESIRRITKEQIQTCYETFYHPANMLLFVVGAVHPQDILDVVCRHQEEQSFAPPFEIKRLYEEEPAEVAEPRKEIRLGTSIPKCLFGYKEQRVGLQGDEWLHQELCTQILLDMLLGPGSDLYTELLKEGLADETFGTEYTLEYRYGFTAIGGNTPDPDKLTDRIRRHLQDTSQVRADDFERIRKNKIGSVLKSLNSPEFIANQFTRFQFNGMNLFDVIPMLEGLRFEDVQQRAMDHFIDEYAAVCVVT